MNILAEATANLPVSTGAILLGIGLFVLSILYMLGQAHISGHLWLRLLLGLLTLGSVLFALGRLFWPVNGLVLTLATYYGLFQSSVLYELSLVMGSIGIGNGLTFLSLIGWKLLSNSQGPTRLKFRSRWFIMFLPVTIFLLANLGEQTGVLTSFGTGMVFIVGFQLLGGVSALNPEYLPWVDMLYQSGLRKVGYALMLMGIVILSVPYLTLL